VQQATKFELRLNLKIVKVLGIIRRRSSFPHD
jgi:hypothetical protein